MTDKCAKCSKTSADVGRPLKRCAKCKPVHYCSRDCQKDDWKAHKKVCAANANANAGPVSSTTNTTNSDEEPLEVHIEKPFHKLHNKTWLRG
ncbi:hypothetical protein BGX29_010880 [Mortierella sp. GBA35]|nr:hypothetical protein BGX29_010880 [Mortierella sp. GBA35]